MEYLSDQRADIGADIFLGKVTMEKNAAWMGRISSNPISFSPKMEDISAKSNANAVIARAI